MTTNVLGGPQRGLQGHLVGGPRGRGPWWTCRVVVVVLLWLCCVVAWPVGVDASVHQILWGRCYSFCLQQHLQLSRHSGEREVDALPKNPIRACQRHPACRWCLYVCERPKETIADSASCHRDCRHTRTKARSRGREACKEACDFVGGAGKVKGGTCPAPASLSGFQSACVASCQGDEDCTRAAEKCCRNTCGSVCTEPLDVHMIEFSVVSDIRHLFGFLKFTADVACSIIASLPTPIPHNIQFKLLKTGGVLVRWDSGGQEESSSGVQRGHPHLLSGGQADGQSGDVAVDPPVVFILRWWCPYISGAVTSVTDRARTRLQGYPTGIHPGSKCHFMVAAVNIHGSRGFSTVSPYIKQFLLPSAPLHLDQVKSRVHNGKVDVTIQWQPPVYTDGLPVFKYQVFWSDSLPRASASYMRLHMHKRVLSADRHTFVLQSLNMGTIYFVQVRAVVKWKRRQKVGKPASTYIETYSPPHQAISGNSERGERERTGGSVIHSVKVNQTYYHDTVLKTHVTWTLKPGKNARKYLIYWRAETCARNEHRKTHPRLETSATSHARSFTLYNLKPECEYAVRVHAVNGRGRTGAATVTSFLTPPCHLIQRPQTRSRAYTQRRQSASTVVRWLSPSSPSSLPHSYDVMWGPTEAGGFSPSTVIYTDEPRNLTVPANTTMVELGRLRGGQHYTIQVWAVSDGGSSPPALLPLVVPPSDEPCASSVYDVNGPQEQTSLHVNSSMMSPQATSDVSEQTRDETSGSDDKHTIHTTSSSLHKPPSRNTISDNTHDVSSHFDVTDDSDDDSGVRVSGGDSGEGGVDTNTQKSSERHLHPTTPVPVVVHVPALTLNPSHPVHSDKDESSTSSRSKERDKDRSRTQIDKDLSLPQSDKNLTKPHAQTDIGLSGPETDGDLASDTKTDIGLTKVSTTNNDLTVSKTDKGLAESSTDRNCTNPQNRDSNCSNVNTNTTEPTTGGKDPNNNINNNNNNNNNNINTIISNIELSGSLSNTTSSTAPFNPEVEQGSGVRGEGVSVRTSWLIFLTCLVLVGLLPS